MRSSRRNGPVQPPLIMVAITLLVGILILANGYYRDSKVSLYCGLFIVVAGVLEGVLRIIRSDEA